MPAGYIPAQDSAYDAWLTTFAAAIDANEAAYGLVAGDSAAINAQQAAYHAAYLLGGLTAPPNPTPVNPATRTPVTIAAKDVAKAASLIVARSYAMIIGANAGVSDADKTAAGLTIRATGRTPIPAPGTNPILGFRGATPLQHTLEYSDSSTPTTKAKPFGAIHLELWRFIGTTPPSGVSAYSFYGDFTKSPLVVDFDSADVGKQAYYIARWSTRRGLDGPWSAPLNSAIV